MNNQNLALILTPKTREMVSAKKLEAYNITLQEQDTKATHQTWLIDTQELNSMREKMTEAQSQGVQIIVLSDRDDEFNVLNILTENNISHLVGQSPYITEEVSVNMLKYHLKNIWGPEKYLRENAKIFSRELFHSRDAKDAVDELIKEVDFSSFFDGPKNYVKVIYNELLTNAFYHMQELPSHDRKESIFVDQEHSIKLKLGIDKQKIVISVQDHIGSLTRDKILKSLRRSFKEKKPNNRTPGAGLGLYLIFHHSNQLVFNCSKQHGNEIIAIIDVNKRYLNYKKRTTSFHYFNED